MKYTRIVLALIGALLVLGGFSCSRQSTETMTEQPAEERMAEQQEVVPPPPEVLSEIEQEGFTDEQKKYIEIINEAPNENIDFFQAELGL